MGITNKTKNKGIDTMHQPNDLRTNGGQNKHRMDKRWSKNFRIILNRIKTQRKTSKLLIYKKEEGEFFVGGSHIFITPIFAHLPREIIKVQIYMSLLHLSVHRS